MPETILQIATIPIVFLILVICLVIVLDLLPAQIITLKS